jgi:hypothetical protein
MGNCPAFAARLLRLRSGNRLRQPWAFRRRAAAIPAVSLPPPADPGDRRRRGCPEHADRPEDPRLPQAVAALPSRAPLRVGDPCRRRARNPAPAGVRSPAARMRTARTGSAASSRARPGPPRSPAPASGRPSACRRANAGLGRAEPGTVRVPRTAPRAGDECPTAAQRAGAGPGHPGPALPRASLRSHMARSPAGSRRPEAAGADFATRQGRHRVGMDSIPRLLRFSVPYGSRSAATLRCRRPRTVPAVRESGVSPATIRWSGPR